jgi:hypothetical protein
VLVSRLDLSVDVAGTPGRIEPEINVRTRARSRAKYWSDATSTGISVGRGDLLVRIYDKAREIAEQSPEKAWFEDLWREVGWDGAALAAAERPLQAPERPVSAPASPNVDSAFIKQFASNVKPLLRSMDVESRQGLLRLLGLEVSAGEPGDVQASVEVPVAPSIVRPIGRTWA